MSRKLLMSSILGVLSLGGAAFFIVGTAGVPKDSEALARLRGTPEYYTSELLVQDLPELVTNLPGAGGEFVQVASTAQYRVGEELDAGRAAAMFGAHDADLRDAITMLIKSKSREDLQSAEQLEVFKTEMQQRVQRIVFPEKKGMIEKILFRDFKIQR